MRTEPTIICRACQRATNRCERTGGLGCRITDSCPGQYRSTDDRPTDPGQWSGKFGSWVDLPIKKIRKKWASQKKNSPWVIKRRQQRWTDSLRPRELEQNATSPLPIRLLSESQYKGSDENNGISNCDKTDLFWPVIPPCPSLFADKNNFILHKLLSLQGVSLHKYHALLSVENTPPGFKIKFIHYSGSTAPPPRPQPAGKRQIIIDRRRRHQLTHSGSSASHRRYLGRHPCHPSYGCSLYYGRDRSHICYQ